MQHTHTLEWERKHEKKRIEKSSSQVEQKTAQKRALTIRISCIQVTADRGKSRSKTETFTES